MVVSCLQHFVSRLLFHVIRSTCQLLLRLLRIIIMIRRRISIISIVVRPCYHLLHHHIMNSNHKTNSLIAAIQPAQLDLGILLLEHSYPITMTHPISLYAHRQYPVTYMSQQNGSLMMSDENEAITNSAPAELRVCSKCRTTTSPEWRKGPSGNKTCV